MIEQLQSLPAGVLGFRAVGTVEPEDYKNVLDPAVDAQVKATGKVNLVYIVGDDFDRYSLGALWEDTRFGIRDPRQWGRVAVVTNHDWLRHALVIFAPITPGQTRVFDVDQEAEAIAWVAEGS